MCGGDLWYTPCFYVLVSCVASRSDLDQTRTVFMTCSFQSAAASIVISVIRNCKCYCTLSFSQSEQQLYLCTLSITNLEIQIKQVIVNCYTCTCIFSRGK